MTTRITVLRLVVLAVIDLALLATCSTAGIGSGWVLAGHAVLSALGFALWLRGGGTAGLAAVVLGILGPIGILAMLPVSRMVHTRPFSRLAGALPARSDDAMFGARRTGTAHRGAELKVARMLDGRVHHATPDTLSSLVTIMRHGDVGARRRALETVVRSFEPALSPLIALALTDGDQTIRALAAAASARVAENLVLARARLTARINDGSDPDARATLAALLADHARADVLLSDSQRIHLREDAVATLCDGPTTRTADPAPCDRLTLEALWAAGDYAAIDRLVDTTTLDPDHDAAPIATWWQAQAAA